MEPDARMAVIDAGAATRGRKADRALPGGKLSTYRHSKIVRVTHWINAISIIVLVMSGLQILNAHSMLYWGRQSTFTDPWITAPHVPDWLTLPMQKDLGGGRRWHFFFAWVFLINGLVYLINGMVRRHFADRFVPTKEELRTIGHSVVEHAQLKWPKGEEARRYNVLQKLTYLGIVFLALPLMLVTGIAMSPGLNAAFPWVLDLLGGRQSARTLHFISMVLIVGFTLLHVGLVVLVGFWNEMRSMVTGRYTIEPGEPEQPEMRA